MPTLTKVMFKRLRVIFSQGPGITACQAGPPVEFHFTNNLLTIGVRKHNILIVYRMECDVGNCANHKFSVPFEQWRESEASRSPDVRFDYGLDEDQVTVKWRQNCQPESRVFDLQENKRPFTRSRPPCKPTARSC